MDRQAFSILCRDLYPLIHKKDTIFRKAIPVQKRVAISLYFLKSGADFGILADVFCIGVSTANRIVLEFIDAVLLKYNGLIRFPTEDEKEAISEGYRRKWQYYDCFGALDGCHIPILSPEESAQEYFSYKGFHSINVLALSDDQYSFRFVKLSVMHNLCIQTRCNKTKVTLFKKKLFI